jgi:hypothetical protein
MQQRSQIPQADDKTTFKALIKGLTPGPTASHLTGKKPKTIDELFRELEEYILSDDDHRRRVTERNEARQGNREMTWRPQSQNPRNINNVESPQPNQNNRPSARGGFSPRGRGRGRGRGPLKLTNHNPRDPYFYCQYHGRGHSTEGCPETKKNIVIIQQEKAMMSIASSMPNQLHQNFWQPQFMNSQPNPVTMQQFQQPNHLGNLLSSFTLSRRQFSQFSSHSQYKKYCHHHLTIRQDKNQVQDLRTRMPCHLSEQSCPSQEDQPWNLKPKSRETTISDP